MSRSDRSDMLTCVVYVQHTHTLCGLFNRSCLNLSVISACDAP